MWRLRAASPSCVGHRSGRRGWDRWAGTQEGEGEGGREEHTSLSGSPRAGTGMVIERETLPHHNCGRCGAGTAVIEKEKEKNRSEWYVVPVCLYRFFPVLVPPSPPFPYLSPRRRLLSLPSPFPHCHAAKFLRITTYLCYLSSPPSSPVPRPTPRYPHRTTFLPSLFLSTPLLRPY
jgi:hypothetical protein